MTACQSSGTETGLSFTSFLSLCLSSVETGFNTSSRNHSEILFCFHDLRVYVSVHARIVKCETLCSIVIVLVQDVVEKRLCFKIVEKIKKMK